MEPFFIFLDFLCLFNEKELGMTQPTCKPSKRVDKSILGRADLPLPTNIYTPFVPFQNHCAHFFISSHYIHKTHFTPSFTKEQYLLLFAKLRTSFRTMSFSTKLPLVLLFSSLFIHASLGEYINKSFYFPCFVHFYFNDEFSHYI